MYITKKKLSGATAKSTNMREKSRFFFDSYFQILCSPRWSEKISVGWNPHATADFTKLIRILLN